MTDRRPRAREQNLGKGRLRGEGTPIGNGAVSWSVKMPREEVTFVKEKTLDAVTEKRKLLKAHKSFRPRLPARDNEEIKSENERATLDNRWNFVIDHAGEPKVR